MTAAGLVFLWVGGSTVALGLYMGLCEAVRWFTRVTSAVPTLDEVWQQNRLLVAEWTPRDDAAYQALVKRGAT